MNYIDPEMIVTAIERQHKDIESIIYKDVLNVSYKIGVNVDEERLKRWFRMCSELEKIDESERIDEAIRKKFEEKNEEIKALNHKIQILQTALDLSSEYIEMEYSGTEDGKEADELGGWSKYFIKKAEGEEE